MKITILGCGSSTGVPVLGCKCAVCLSDNPRNKRSRVSIFVEEGDLRLLIDASPDLREQSLRHNILDVNTVLFTHAHADHVHGIDELRNFNYLGNRALDAYMDTTTYTDLKTRFSYCFEPPIPAFGWFRPALQYKRLEAGENITINGVNISAFKQIHGQFIERPEPYITLGIRIGDFAYSTDVKHLPEESLEALRGVKHWVVDCLREEEAPTHAHLAVTLTWIASIKPEKAYLTHMNHTLDYETLRKNLPQGVEPAYDGQVIII